MKNSSKKIKTENLLRADVELEFYREGSYGTTESRSITFSFSCNSSEDADILNGLKQELIKNESKSEYEEEVSEIGLYLEQILKIIQKSKTIESFKKEMTKYVIRENWDRLIRFFMGRDGDPKLKLKDVLNDSSWEDYYGCNVDVNVTDLNEKKLEEEREEKVEENRKLLYNKLDSSYKKLQEKQKELENRLGDKDLDLNNLVEECVNLGKEYANLKMTYTFLCKDNYPPLG